MTPATRPSRTIALTAAGGSVPENPTTSRSPASSFGDSPEAALGAGGVPSPRATPKAKAPAASPQRPAIAARFRRLTVNSIRGGA